MSNSSDFAIDVIWVLFNRPLDSFVDLSIVWILKENTDKSSFNMLI
jgi:hypothetical protein